MLYLLYGNDTNRSRKKLNSLINALLAKKQDASLVRIQSDDFSPREVFSYADAQGLFETRTIVVLDTVCENTTNKEILADAAERLAQSNNVFIAIEGALDAKTVKKIEKHAEKVQEFSLPQSRSKKKPFNIFELADALGQRDRKRMWVLLQIGTMHNTTPEEMHGILFWGLKNIQLARSASSAKDATLSPFVYNKAKRFAGNFSDAELLDISEKLVELYHQSRRGQVPFAIGLEQFVLQFK